MPDHRSRLAMETAMTVSPLPADLGRPFAPLRSPAAAGAGGAFLLGQWHAPASLRAALSGLASDADALDNPHEALKRLRPLFAAAMDRARSGSRAKRAEPAASGPERRLVDAAVAGLLHFARAALDAGAAPNPPPPWCQSRGSAARRAKLACAIATTLPGSNWAAS
jgi:hypothetical protein